MIAVWYLNNNDFIPVFSPTRTEGGAAAYLAAWNLIESEVSKKWPDKD